MYKIHIICGKSGSGKDSVMRKILEKSSSHIADIPWTTRPMREKEHEGVEYFFRSESEFLDIKENHPDWIVEYREYETNQGKWIYWHQRIPDDKLHGKHVVTIGTPDMIEKYVEAYGEENINVIYLKVSMLTQLTRLMRREDRQIHKDYRELCRRVISDQDWDINPAMMPNAICSNLGCTYTEVNAELDFPTVVQNVRNVMDLFEVDEY